MRARRWFVLAGALGIVHASSAFAVNCDQVRKYAKTGRTVDDIAETMIVDVNEVKKCLQGEAGTEAPTPAAAAEKKP